MTTRPLFSIVIFSFLLVLDPLSADCQNPVGVGEPAQLGDALPEGFSPRDGARIPRLEEDLHCSNQGPCWTTTVRGRVPPGQWPFLAVAPLNAAPKIWIQSPITMVRRNGEFEGTVHLGTPSVGAGQRYNIRIVAHPDKERFKEELLEHGLPEDCLASDPITVLRKR
ncbi:MAG: hypothetical protein AAGF23_04690 [Acidobacteriota bacterium]